MIMYKYYDCHIITILGHFTGYTEVVDFRTVSTLYTICLAQYRYVCKLGTCSVVN